MTVRLLTFTMNQSFCFVENAYPFGHETHERLQPRPVLTSPVPDREITGDG